MNKFSEYLKLNNLTIIKKKCKDSNESEISNKKEKKLSINEDLKKNKIKINHDTNFSKEKELEKDFNKNILSQNNFKIENIDINRINCQNNDNCNISNEIDQNENGYINNVHTINKIYFNNFNNINDNNFNNFINNVNKNYKEDYLEENKISDDNKYKFNDCFKEKVL